MHCPKCEAELSDNAAFCSLCFTKFDQPAAAPSAGAIDASAPAIPGGIPPDEAAELERIRREVGGHDAPLSAVNRPPEVALTTGRKFAAVVGGAVVGYMVGYVAGFLPIPFIGLAGPFAGGMFAGWIVQQDGGRYGVISAAIPATIQLALAVLIMAGVAGALSGSSAGNPQSDMLGGMMGSLVGIGVIVLAIGIAIQLVVGYFGGRAGERVFRGPGWGV